MMVTRESPVRSRTKSFGEILRMINLFFQTSAAKTMARNAKTSLKSAILVLVNRAAAELAGIWP